MASSINFAKEVIMKLGLLNSTFSSKDMISKSVMTMRDVKQEFITKPYDDRFGSKMEIEAIAKTNFCIIRLLNKYNLPIKVNIDELEKLRQGHLEKTRDLVSKMYANLPDDLKKDINIFDLQSAALLHDFGKVLIPNKILNKEGKLNFDEREIMQLHSELGYELLKNKGLNERVLKLIKYHHQNLHKKGYPCVERDFEFGVDMQILSIADKYSALREQRCYKNPFGKYEALEIIAKEVNQGLISQDVYTALIRSV